MTRRTTTQRGLGHQHQKTREQLLAAHIDGTPCNLCGQPMYKRTQQLDAGHTIPRAINPNSKADCLQHAPCNRGEGATIAKQARGTTTPSRAWT